VTYLQTVYLPTARKFGLRAEIATEAISWSPTVAGTVRLRVEPTSTFRALDLTDRGGIVQIGGVSLVSGEDAGTTERMKNRALRRLAEVGRSAQIQVQSVQSATSGAMLFLLGIFERSIAGFQAIVGDGGTAEQAADVAVEDLFAYLPTYAVLDKYLADQLLIYAALADGESKLATCELTAHALTTTELIRHFLPIRTRLQGLPGQKGEIGVTGAPHGR
jgi:RNA 3'-terminal phosphate cyclase (ATP)